MTPLVNIQQRYNLISVPKPIRIGIQKQETDPNIKHEPEVDDNGDIIIEKISQQRNSAKNKKHTINEKRSQSQRAILKTKLGPPEKTEEEKQKEIKKRQQYAMRLKQNLERLKQEKALKEEEERRVKAEKQESERRKEEERKKYLQISRQKLKHYKQKEEESERQKQQEEKMKKDRVNEDHKRKERELLERHKENIKKVAGMSIEKTKKLEHSRDRVLKQIEKISKESPPINEQAEADKARMLEVKSSLDSGALKEIVNEHDKQLTELFQAYWVWEKKRIDLNSMALMLKDFNISPEYISPKVLADTFKPLSKGQPLDFPSFVECLTKCSYRSKLLKDSQTSQSSLDADVLKQLFTLLKMKQWNYKQVIRKTKNHIG